MPSSQHSWPDGVDMLGLAAVGTLLIALPLLGYVFMYLDYRAYLRSLRRALVVVSRYGRSLPDWVRRDTPPCLVALGLAPGCTRDEVLAAYRSRVKRAHPDAGGNQRDFARLQLHLEQALELVEPAGAGRG